ncbi:hypothetical protein V8C86DRAFT_2879354 [Haematococcus lacustris]
MSDSAEYESNESGSDALMEADEEEEEEDSEGADSSGNASDMDHGLDPDVASSRRPLYKILNKQDLQLRRDDAIREVTSVLGISDDDALRVLRKYKWDVNRVHDQWFSDMDAVKASVGLQDPGPSTSADHATCMVCFDTFPLSEMRSAACRHHYCSTCWRGYVKNAIANGPASLDLRCPTPKCKACVPADLILSVAEPADAERWSTFALRSFVEDNRNMSWCVGQGCEAAVECKVDRAADEALDVSCSCCGATFCFSCHEDAHRPVRCAVVRQWVTKNSAESENVTWIIANTKPCPKCHRPIEKNQGCMHMTCSQCKYEFCWLCQGEWKEHGERTGGYYNCNRFEAARRKGDFDEEASKRENAKQSLERYMHFFERWDAHQKARVKARSDSAIVSREWLERLSEQTKTPTSQLKFIMDAWQQIIECRRVLSWTYTYGYYSFDPQSPTAKADANNKTFFEFLQGDAENSLERLHEAAEKQVKKVMEDFKTAPGSSSIEAFMTFRKRLIGLTDVTRGYFDKLVAQLERGFNDLEKDFAGGQQDPSQGGPQEAGDSSGSEGLGPAPGLGGAGSSSLLPAAVAAAANRRSKRTRGTAGDARQLFT